MPDFELTTPVVLLIFNRPDTTARVFAEIAHARPKQLFVVADGPRADHPDDVEKCAATRAIINQVDWECIVEVEYAHTNLGLRRRVSSGLNWVFEQVEDAIILEDDCMPDPTFFRFCQELLAKYRNDERIMVVSGNNFQHGKRYSEDSYYFSRYNHCWGWATWRRAWQLYDDEMQDWPQVKDTGQLAAILEDEQAVHRWVRLFDSTFRGEINTWAYRWLYSCWISSGLTILPQVNLVENIGFGTNATNTTHLTRAASVAAVPMQFPLIHPPNVMRNVNADRYTEQTHYSVSWVRRLKRRLVWIRQRLQFG